MPRRICVLAVAAVLAGACGVPQDVAKQAEQVGSIAAEGALLARDVRQGESTATFARVHAEALREKLAPLAKAIEHDELGGVARVVDARLGSLERHPADSNRAAAVEDALHEAAEQADEIARGAST